MKYKVIRSRRKTFALEIKGTELIVRAPERASDKSIENVVMKRMDWIEKHLAKAQARADQMSGIQPLNADEMKKLFTAAKKYIPERVAYFAAAAGVDYGRITIRAQRSRWGSCSAKGNLNFNCLLMLAPPEVLDSVVVHELCHRKYMNHSKQFYAEVLRVFPEYHKWNSWLKEHGSELMAAAHLQA